MKNKVIFAAAGNGKTYDVCKEAISLSQKTDKYVLLVTYTNEGVRSLEEEYRKQNYGVIDKNVVVKTWYSFLLSELIKPYQCFLALNHYKNNCDFPIPENFIKSIAFYDDNPTPRYYSKTHIQYYINQARDIRKDNVSSLACRCIDDSSNKVISRLEKIYSHIFFDELQDYAGWDLEIFKHLFSSKLVIKCVGDHKQSTFTTNNSQKNNQFKYEKIQNFFIKKEKKGICSLSYENTTRRFNNEICNFINAIHNDTKSQVYPCDNHTFDSVGNMGVYIIDEQYMEQYCMHYSPVILRYQRNSGISFKHKCDVFNYGNSKGSTFERVVIIPVKTVTPFILEQKNISANGTRSKFYVACTRAKYSVVFAMNKPKETPFFKPVSINLNGSEIPVYRHTLPI